jgi:hypothetical protein
MEHGSILSISPVFFCASNLFGLAGSTRSKAFCFLFYRIRHSRHYGLYFIHCVLLIMVAYDNDVCDDSHDYSRKPHVLRYCAVFLGGHFLSSGGSILSLLRNSDWLISSLQQAAHMISISLGAVGGVFFFIPAYLAL